MKHKLQIQLRDTPGAVLRALGLIERRGFRIDSCRVHEVQAGERAVEVALDSERPGDLIQRQLERLHDVVHVELGVAALPRKSPAGVRPLGRRS